MSGPMPPPAQFLDLSQINALNAKRDALKEQMERARALGQPSGRKYATWSGALAGGLGDVLGSIAGQTKEGRLAEELAKNQEAERAARGEFNTALMRPDMNPEEQERFALSAIASGDPAFSATGKAALEHGDIKLKRTLEAQRLKEEADNKRIDNERQAEMAANLQKYRQWMMENPQMAYLFGQGADGTPQMFGAPTRMPAGQTPTATPVTTPAGEPVTKPNELSTDDKKALKAAADDVVGINELVAEFKPEFVGGGSGAGKVAEVADALGGGGGISGKVVGGLSKALGGLGEEGIKERSTWFRKYDALVNLPERNNVFGASLSAGEKASWDAAATVARGNDPAAAQKALLWLQTKANEKLAGLREQTTAEGANPKAVEALTRRAGPPPGAAPPLDTSTPVREPPRTRAPPPADEIIEYGGKRYKRGPNGEAIPL